MANNSQNHQTATSDYQFLDKMQALQEVSLALYRTASLEELYRQAVELGRTRLGFDRLGLLLYDEANGLMHGAFGTDEQGNLRDERDYSEPIEDPRLLQVLHSAERIGYWPETQLRDFGQVIGQGWNAMAVLWSGDKAIGWLAADNLLKREPLTYHLDILKLYGATLGHLISQKQSEEALHRQERARYQTLFDNAADTIVVMDMDGRLTDCNASFMELIGYGRDEVIGQYITRFFAPASLPTFKAMFPLLHAKGYAEGEVQFMHKSGHAVDVWNKAQLWRDDQENLQGIVLFSRDITDRKTVERELNLRQSALEAAADGVVITDKQGSILWVNRAFTNLTQYSREEAIGGNPRLLKSGAHDEAFYRQLWQSLLDGRVWQGEITNRRKDGSLYQEDMSITPVHSANGEISHFVAIKRDISQRKTSEERQRQESALLTSLVDSIPDLIFYKDVAGVYLGCNTAFAQFAGRPVDDIVGKTDFDLFPEEVAAFFREQDTQMMAQDEARHNEEWVDYPDGRRVLLNTLKTPFYDADKNLLGLIGISRDVTAAYHAQEELRRLGYVVEQSLDGTAVANLDGIVEFVNPAWATMHGYTVDELIGQHLSVFHTPEQLANEVDPVNQRALASGQAQRAEIGHVRKDGVTFPTLMTIDLLRDENAQPIGLVAATQDITDRKVAERALQENQERLEEATRIARLHYWEFDVATQMFTFLPAYYELLGTTAEEEGGYTMSAADYARKYVPDYEAGIVQQEIIAALTADDPNYSREIDSLNRTKDGRVFPIRVRFRVLKDNDGNTIKFIGANQDITDQVKTEQALRERESLLRTIIDSTPDWIFVKDLDHRYLLVNQGYANSFNMSPADFIGKNDLDIGFPEEIVKGNPEKGIRGFWADDREIMERGEIKIIDVEPAVVDGQQRFLNTIKAPLKDSTGQVVGIVGFVHDITERIAAEETLAKQAAQLQTVAEISTSVSTILDQTSLLQNIVDLTKERFDLYHSHIYLLDPSGKSLVLVAGAGEVGQIMTAEGRSIPLAQERSLVARAARSKQSIIIDDVQAEPGFLPHPLLPETKSEMAVPLLAGDQVIGVLDIQADQTDYFSEDDANIQTTLATQIAIAVENARLLTETQRAFKELDALTRRLTRESWENYLQAFERPERGFAYDYGQLLALDHGGVNLSTASIHAENQANGLLAHPLVVNGEPIGRLALFNDEDEAGQTAVSAAEMEEIIAAVAEQLSARIENIRLTEQTQAALSLTERLYQAGHRINSAGSDLQEALAAVNEAGPIPIINRGVLFLFERDADGEMRAISVAANWHNGSGTKPTAVNTRYEREAMAALGLMTTKDTLLFDDAQHDERIDPTTKGVFKALNIQSLVVIPLWVGSRQLGSILLEAEEVHHFTEKEIEPYVALSGQLAIAVDRQRLLSQAQKRAERERQIRTITDKIRRGVDREAILQIARDEIGRMLGAQTVAGQLGTPSLLLDKLNAADKDPKQNGRQ